MLKSAKKTRAVSLLLSTFRSLGDVGVNRLVATTTLW